MKKMIVAAVVFATITLAGCAQSGAGTTGESERVPEAEAGISAEAEPAAGSGRPAETVAPAAEVGQPAETSPAAPTVTPAPPAAPAVASSSTTAPPAAAPPAVAPAGVDIGEARAKEIALSHAGLKESDVVFVRVHLDYDDWRREYEVEFYSGNVEYDYDVDAETGEIRSYDYDAEHYAPRGRPATTPPAGGGSSAEAPPAGDIGEAKAKEIALAHAGYFANDVRWLSAERDFDDGRLEYDVEFYVGNIEYSYEIDASSGTVMSYEAEQDD